MGSTSYTAQDWVHLLIWCAALRPDYCLLLLLAKGCVCRDYAFGREIYAFVYGFFPLDVTLCLWQGGSSGSMP